MATYVAIHTNGWAQYGIDLPGSLLGFLCRLNIVPLDRDNGTSNSSNTDVVEKVNFLVAASQHGGTSVAEGSPYYWAIARGQKWLCFGQFSRGDPFLLIFSKTKF